MPNPIKRIGVVGAGTMGSGIALSALYAGYKVVLQDAFPASLEKGGAYIEKFLAKKEKSVLSESLQLTEEIGDLADCDLVIEAALEDLDLKRQIFADLEKHCAAEAILATNTSTLSVTAIAAACAHPGRIGGLHFFNPAPVLPLVEVIRAAQTSASTIEALLAFAESLGKTPVVVTDTPGFIVNRVARPFYGEALRILGEGAATHAQIDRIVEQAGDFRMGPFRLMDLIGIDINAGAMRSMYEQTHGEPRYRPHPIQMAKLASGDLGRKTGRGFYDYETKTPSSDKDKESGNEAEASGTLWLSDGSWAPDLAQELSEAGYALDHSPSHTSPKAAFIVAGRYENARELIDEWLPQLPQKAPIFAQTADVALSEYLAQALDPRIIGFDGLFAASKFLTLQRHQWLSREVQAQAEDLLTAAGFRWEWTDESPALVLPRILAQLVNEAAFALQDGVAESETIDTAMKLGVNYPLGPLEWGAKIGYQKVLAILDHLYAEFHEDRYRACGLLRRWVRTGTA